METVLTWLASAYVKFYVVKPFAFVRNVGKKTGGIISNQFRPPNNAETLFRSNTNSNIIT